MSNTYTTMKPGVRNVIVDTISNVNDAADSASLPMIDQNELGEPIKLDYRETSTQPEPMDIE
ncbi:21743_t:CDS:2, partial [Gigaspora rosea]